MDSSQTSSGPTTTASCSSPRAADAPCSASGSPAGRCSPSAPCPPSRATTPSFPSPGDRHRRARWRRAGWRSARQAALSGALSRRRRRTGRDHVGWRQLWEAAPEPGHAVEHDGIYAAVASKGGSPLNPDWSRNLVDPPLVELPDGATSGALRRPRRYGSLVQPSRPARPPKLPAMLFQRLGLAPGSWSCQTGAAPCGSGSDATCATSIVRSTPCSCSEAI